MHNLETNFAKFLALVKDSFQDSLDSNENFQHYPNQPKLNDCGVLALALMAESLSIDSENLLFVKLRCDYPAFFSRLPDLSNYNRRKRRLKEKLDVLLSTMAGSLMPDKGDYLIDSIPVPVCRLVRASRLRILKDDQDRLPAFGYSPIDRQYFFGYKLHMLSAESGVIKHFQLAPANLHDVELLSDLTVDFIYDCSLLGDKGYISRSGQLQLFEQNNVLLKTLKKKNQSSSQIWTPVERKKRKRIETLFSQLCDQLMLKRNYAKSFDGFGTGILVKIAAFTALQKFNTISGRRLNLIKHALAF